MDDSAFDLPQPPSLAEVAAEIALAGKLTYDQMVDTFLELEYQREAEFVVDRLIAQTPRRGCADAQRQRE